MQCRQKAVAGSLSIQQTVRDSEKDEESGPHPTILIRSFIVIRHHSEVVISTRPILHLFHCQARFVESRVSLQQLFRLHCTLDNWSDSYEESSWIVNQCPFRHVQMQMQTQAELLLFNAQDARNKASASSDSGMTDLKWSIQP